MTKPDKRILAVVAIAILSIDCLSTAARGMDSSEYCGLYAVYGASVALGRPVAFNDLLKAKYIGTSHGSTAAELVRALTDSGFKATVFSGLGVESLRAGPTPMILHVAAGEQLESYNHWILYLGCDGGRGITVDSVEGEQRVPLAQILSRWDGNAIFVGNQTFNHREVVGPVLVLYVQYGLVVLIAILLSGRWLEHRWPSARSPLRACGRDVLMILGLGVAAGLLYHTCDSAAGFFRNPGPTSFVAVAHLGDLIPERSLAEVESLAATGKVGFIDARFAPDYEAGHLPGAISLPIDATPKQRATALANFSRHQPLVVYCQSVGCHFAEVISHRLIREGFTNVSIFAGGWVEWKRRDPPKVQGERPRSN